MFSNYTRYRMAEVLDIVLKAIEKTSLKHMEYPGDMVLGTFSNRAKPHLVLRYLAIPKLPNYKTMLERCEYQRQAAHEYLLKRQEESIKDSDVPVEAPSAQDVVIQISRTINEKYPIGPVFDIPKMSTSDTPHLYKRTSIATITAKNSPTEAYHNFFHVAEEGLFDAAVKFVQRLDQRFNLIGSVLYECGQSLKLTRDQLATMSNKTLCQMYRKALGEVITKYKDSPKSAPYLNIEKSAKILKWDDVDILNVETFVMFAMCGGLGIFSNIYGEAIRTNDLAHPPFTLLFREIAKRHHLRTVVGKLNRLEQSLHMFQFLDSMKCLEANNDDRTIWYYGGPEAVGESPQWSDTKRPDKVVMFSKYVVSELYGGLLSHPDFEFGKIPSRLRNFKGFGFTFATDRIALSRIPTVMNSIITYNEKRLIVQLSRLGGDKYTSKVPYHLFSEIKDRNIVEDILRSAIKYQTRGINILIAGPPGNGKTEFASAVAKQVDRDAYFCGEMSSVKTALESSEVREGKIAKQHRVAQIETAQSIRKLFNNGILVVDEADDVLIRDSDIPSIAYHRMLEMNSVPTIWITNYPEYLSPALLRRMTYVVYVDHPSEKGRATILRYYLDKYKVKLPESTIEHLAKTYKIPASAMHEAIKSARSAKNKREMVEALLQSAEKCRTCNFDRDYAREKDRRNPLEHYDLSAVNSELDLTKFIERVKSPKVRRNFTMCLYGPSGTGKSAFARYLARELGMEVLLKQVSDLVSKYVGDTEKLIRKAFREAEEENKLLILDEADSFLRERSRARNSWEVTEVNQLLTCMENTTIPVVCTTNLMDSIDAAALRRFTFKAKFDFLESHQTAKVFKSFFGYDAPREVLNLTNVTPGDIAAAYDKMYILGEENNADEVAKAISEEVAIKPESVKKSKIGFDFS